MAGYIRGGVVHDGAECGRNSANPNAQDHDEGGCGSAHAGAGSGVKRADNQADQGVRGADNLTKSSGGTTQSGDDRRSGIASYGADSACVDKH